MYFVVNCLCFNMINCATPRVIPYVTHRQKAWGGHILGRALSLFRTELGFCFILLIILSKYYVLLTILYLGVLIIDLCDMQFLTRTYNYVVVIKPTCRHREPYRNSYMSSWKLKHIYKIYYIWFFFFLSHFNGAANICPKYVRCTRRSIWRNSWTAIYVMLVRGTGARSCARLPYSK